MDESKTIVRHIIAKFQITGDKKKDLYTFREGKKTGFIQKLKNQNIIRTLHSNIINWKTMKNTH